MSEKEEKKLSLIDISGSIQNIVDSIIESGGEVTDEAFAELEEFRGKLEIKAGSIAYVIKNVMEARINRLKDLEKQAKDKRLVEENAQKRLKDYLKNAMESTNTPKIKSDLYSISISAGKQKVDIVDIDKVPSCYINTTIEHKPDKKALLEALKNGLEVPGVELVKGDSILRIS